MLCVDGVDRCGHTLEYFLDAVLLKKPLGPLKILFTSRPAVFARRQVNSPLAHPELLRLHDIEQDISRADIQLYVGHELCKIPELQEKYGDSWPPPEVERIVEHSDGLFIVATTIVGHISNSRGDPVERFRSSNGIRLVAGDDQHYQKILDEAMSNLKPWEKEDMCSCLSLLVVAQRPLSIVEYAALLCRPVRDIDVLFRSLHPAVEVPTTDDDNQLVPVYLPYFVDFLTGRTAVATSIAEDTSARRAVDKREAHTTALERCLLLMDSDDPKRGVHFGVSGALTSYHSNDDQPQKLRLRSDLAYACTSWGNHALKGMPLSEKLQASVKTFLEAKGLYWLEALSAEKNVGYSGILWEISKVGYLVSCPFSLPNMC